MDDIFLKIIAREIPGHFIYEDDVCVAILDKFPVNPGQTLIIPRKKVDYLFDLDEETYTHLFDVARTIAPALDQVFDTVRTCVLVEGLEVPHVHIKLYPITKPNLHIHGGTEMDDDTLANHAKNIRKVLENAG